jgi:lipopolysaccharide transport system permease protein
MVVFSIIFGRLAKVPSDGVPYPIFAYAALIPWTYFSGAMSKSTESLVNNVAMLTKVYFPRLIIPMAPVLAGLVDFAIVQLLMYAAPVVWPVSLIPDTYRLIYGIYPMAGVIEGFRSSLLGTNPMPWDLVCIGSLSAILIAVSGALYFRRMERIFADVA